MHFSLVLPIKMFAVSVFYAGLGGSTEKVSVGGILVELLALPLRCIACIH